MNIQSAAGPGTERRVTQQDVADLVGVSRSAVSMAFKNHPRISPAMRKRIQNAATKLGYEPDPMLSSLAAYRTRLRPSGYHGTLAWLVNSEGGYEWNGNAQFVSFFEGARDAARRHGFQLEVMDIVQDGVARPARTAAILRARNITGVLVAPQPAARTRLKNFPWRDFSAVALGYTLVEPRLHVVAAAQFQAVVECVRKLRETGHRRIGFVLSREHVERTRLQYLGAWLAMREMEASQEPVPPLLMSKAHEPGRLRAWLDKHRPDGVISGDYLPGLLRQLGRAVPQDISVACPNLPHERCSTSGVWETPLASGAAAADLLVSLIHRGERGAPASPQTVLVEGRWLEGKTLRGRADERAGRPPRRAPAASSG